MHSPPIRSDLRKTQKTPCPNVLLRAFAKEEYARDFIGGAVRVGLLTSYREAQDLRKDETEGEVRVVWRLANGNRVYDDHSPLTNYYILSTSHPETERHVLTGFGSYVVRISDPQELLKRIQIAWQQNPLASGRCVIDDVSYDKDELLVAAPCLIAPTEYSYSQKPKRYSVEKEFRYVLTCVADVVKLKALVGEGLALEDHLTLPLPDCSDICSLTRSEP
jgi:hypothetical protein